jgi:allophanate hydrolase subunit 1
MDSKNFVAIGKILFETPGFPWNVPHSHFIVNKTPFGLFEATNLDLILDSAGDSLEEAVQALAKLTAHFVMEIMLKRRGHDELREVVDTSVMEDYWREYRKIEVDLSRTKRDLSHTLDRLRVEAIKETMDEYVKEIIYAKAKQDAEAVYAAVKDMIPAGVSLSIEYKALEVA